VIAAQKRAEKTAQNNMKKGKGKGKLRIDEGKEAGPDSFETIDLPTREVPLSQPITCKNPHSLFPSFNII
jgi:hypothetical protein